MSSDETPKIEPALTETALTALEIKAEPAKSESTEAPKTEAAPDIKVEAKAEPAKIEPKPEPKAEAPTLPPAPQIELPKSVIPLRRPEAKTEPPASQPRTSARFALLWACLARGAGGGGVVVCFVRLFVAKFAAVFAPQAEPVPVAKDPTPDEIKSLRDSVAQLRIHMRSLTENVAALKTTVNATTAAASQQNSRVTEALERIEKAQAEQKKLAAQPAPAVSTTEVTGSIAQKQQQQQQQQQQAVPMVLGDPPTTLKPPILHDYIVRRVYDGAALIEGRNGIIEVETGVVAPGLGRIEAIRRQDGRGVVVTARGLILQR